MKQKRKEKSIAKYRDAEMKSMAMHESVGCPIELIKDVIQDTREQILNEYRDTPIPGSLIMGYMRKNIMQHGATRRNGPTANNQMFDGDGKERELFADAQAPTQAERFKLIDVARASMAKFICAQPAGIIYGRATVSGDPNQTAEHVFTNEEMGWLIMAHAWRVIERFGFDQYGLIDGMRRPTIWTGNDNDGIPEYRPAFGSLTGFYKAKYEGSHISYKMLTTAKIELDKIEREVFDTMFNFWKLESPESESFAESIRPKGNAGNLSEQTQFYTVHGFHTVDKVTGQLVWHKRKTKKFYSTSPNFSKFPHAHFKKAI